MRCVGGGGGGYLQVFIQQYYNIHIYFPGRRKKSDTIEKINKNKLN
jgi:hypothetical protein